MESSRPADGERSGQQQEQPVLAEPQQPPDPIPTRGATGRLHHRQSKRSDLLLRLQQHQNPAAAAAAWQPSDAPGPSGGRFPSPSTSSTPPLPFSSSSRGQHTQGVSSQSSQDVAEGGGPSKRGEKKPQKPGKYVCTYCGRPCAKPSVLQKHIRSHTGERPYPCVPCGFSFKTKSNLYKHRKSHAHRIKAGLVSSRDEASLSGAEVGAPGEEPEEPTEGESTDSEEETGQHGASTSKERMGRQRSSGGAELPGALGEEAHRSEDSQAVKQRLARRLCERKRGPHASPDDQPSTSSSTSSSLGPGSKGSTESGYFSCSGSTELSQISPPSANVKSYAEIILGKYGRLGGQQRGPHQQHLHPSPSPLGPEDKSLSFSVPKTQVIEHITKLITINEAVVDTSEIDSVKPRRSSLSRKSSLESLKFSSPKDPYVFEPPKGESPGPSTSGGSHAPNPNPAGVQESSAVPLLRSHSMPSSASQGDPSAGTATPRGYRLSQSFDEQQAAMAEMRVGHAQRMLKRQPAIEVPLGAELTLEEAGPSSSSMVLKGEGPAQEMLQRQQQQQQQQRQACRGSFPYECEACGARCKKRKSFEAHRGLCPGQPLPDQERANVGGESRENRPQMMHYKFRALAMAVRKRRKEESLEEDPPSPGPAAVSCSPLEPTSVPSRLEHSAPSQAEQQQDRKGVSVIQHTSSFEKQESISMENQELEFRESQPTQQQPEPKPSPSTSRLVRQHNIQVPEILVTVEPDADMPSVSPPATASSSKELDRVEEFQWPPRSQSLAQLPAEKLPPKKKRLRLAEATHSSGESSFESVSLPRSPSQDSNVSHTSSRSASVEDTGKPESTARSSSSQGSHMLTVPSVSHQHQQPHKEMRRSASEQAPASPQHTAPIPETRSKSFDYGSLSPQQPASTWKERRKCLLVKHATLGEAEPEEGATKSQLSRAGSPKPGPSYPFPQVLYPAEATTSRLSPEAIGKTLQLFQPQRMPFPQAVLPLQPRGPEVFPPGPLAQLLPVTTAIPEVLSSHIFRQAFLHTHPAPPPIQLHPAQLRAAERLGLPLHPFPGLLPLQLPTMAGPGQAVYFPVPPGLTIQVPSQPPPGIREPRPGTSSMSPTPACRSPAPLSFHHSRPVIATCLAQLTPAVSLVVPVRLQTHMPTYASAMYTTLSQILASAGSQEPVCCEAMVVMGQLEQDKLQRSYLRIPTPDFKSYLPLSLPVELGLGPGAGEAYGPLGPGGSKRMLSPAASLELSTEAKRQQKRVKEEEEREEQVEEEEEKTGEALENKDDGKKLEGGEKTEPESVKVETVTIKVEAEEEGKRVLGEPSRTGEKEEEVPGKAEPKPDEKEQEQQGEQEEQGPGVSGAHRPRSPPRPTAPSYPSLHTTTSVSWCYLNYVKPNPSAQTEPQASVYSSWSVSVHNPNLPGLSTKVALSLLRSKQNHSSETYTMATGRPPATGKLVTASSRKPRVSEVHATPPSTPVKVKEPPLPEKEEKKRGRREKEGPSTSKQSEPPRVRIFEGGYKSNEEYVYVRGRGRGKYVCGDCGIRCKKPSMLRKHIRTHTDVRPYVCKHCNFAFKTKGNLTKHMKSKAHGKKCQSMGVSELSLDEPESEEAEGSEEQLFGSEDQEEHQFSEAEDSEEEDDNEEEEEEEDEEEEEESSSHDDPSSSCSSDMRHSTGGLSSSGRRCEQGTAEPEPLSLSPSLQLSQQGTPEPLGLSPSLQLSPRRPLASRHSASPGTRRALFARSGSNASPRAFSPSGESCSPIRSLSPRTELSSPSQHMSPSTDRGQCPIKALSPLQSLSPIRTPYLVPFVVRHRPPGYLPWERPAAIPSNVLLERSGIPGLVSPEASMFSPAFHLSPSEGSGHLSPTSEDQVFSHLPMHSQQAKVPYLMIPIGGIQMVQAQPRCHPITTASLPCSPSLDVPSLALPKGGGPWGGNLTTRLLRTPGDHRLKKQETVTSQSGLCDNSTAPSCTIPETTDSKQYSSSYSSSHNDRSEARTAGRCLSERHTEPPLSQPASLTSYRTGQTVQRAEPLLLQPREGGSKREPDRID